MPAIDPARLARQVADLQPLATEPAQLTQAVTRLAGEYRVRTRHAPEEESWLPPPVHRAILHALRLALGSDSAAGGRAAAALWEATPVAVKLLAAGLIGSYAEDFAADLAEAWATESVPAELVQQLGEVGLTSWRRTHPAEFLQRAEAWLGDRRRRLLALCALRAAAQETEFEDLPAVFQLLDGIGGRLRGESKRAFGLLIKTLAGRSGAETSQFLEEQMERGGAGTAWMKTLLSDRAFGAAR
ncbi:MAG: hypothetical protein ACRDHG_12225 [Anaerolineales bacterium]